LWRRWIAPPIARRKCRETSHIIYSCLSQGGLLSLEGADGLSVITKYIGSIVPSLRNVEWKSFSYLLDIGIGFKIQSGLSSIMQKGDRITQFKLLISIRNVALWNENKKSRVQEGILEHYFHFRDFEITNFGRECGSGP
jgi:hypothetical protein